MPIEDERTLQIREMQGVNQAIDARINAPGTFWSTKNYYARRRGVLSPRPGSLVVSYQLKYPTTTNAASPIGAPTATTLPLIIETGVGTMGWAQGMDNHIQTQILRPNDVTMAAVNNPKPIRSLILKPATGQIGYTSASERNASIGFTINDTNLQPLVVTPQNPSSNSGSHRIDALCRVYFDEGANRLLIAAVSGEAPLGDRLGYVDKNGVLQIMSANGFNSSTGAVLPGALITSVGARWQILNYHYVADPNAIVPNSGSGGWFAIATNRIDPPIVIYPQSDLTALLPVAAGYTSLIPEHSQAAPGLSQLSITTQETANANFVVTGIQSMCFYNNALVIGGYCLWHASNGLYKDFTNSVVFTDPGKPYSLTSDTANTYNIPVGDNINEPITFVTPTSVMSDTQGLTSQLVIFTEKKIRIFSGVPPVSGSQSASNLMANNTADVGCSAPKTVVRTPHGLVFLGSDGYIYLLDNSGHPRIISYALENMFFGLSPRQMAGCAATYRLGWYYLSYPSGLAGASTRPNEFATRSQATNQTFRNDAQLWCDMRFLSMMGGEEGDLGAKWYGPMTNLYASCFAIANGPEDFNDLYIGWDHNPTISQMLVPEYTTDPTHNDPSKTMTIENEQVLGEIDMGNAHIEKTVTAVSIGARTDAPAVVTLSIVANGDGTTNGSAQGRGYQQQTLVNPPGTTWNNSTWGGGYWTPQESFAMIAMHPAYDIRGRSFNIEFKSTPPYVIDATNNKLDWSELVGGTFAATIASGTYSPSTDSITNTSLQGAIQTALNAASPGKWTVTYDIQANSFTLTYIGSSTATLLWSSGANHATSIGTTLGFDTTVDTGSLTNGLTAQNTLTPAPTGTPPLVSFSDIEVRYRPIPRLP